MAATQDDPYSVLGVPRDAEQDAIRKAYRALAKRLHPDLNPGDKEAEERFKCVSAAHKLLGDPETRARFDRGEIDASGQERPPEGFYRSHAEGPQGARYRKAGPEDFEDLGDIFSDLFGGRRGQGRPGVKMRGADLRYELAVDFLDAIRGARRRITMPDGKTLDLTIPAGLRDGQALRLKGKGLPGHGGGPAGDALVAISVAPHPLFRREGDDIHVELPVAIHEAALGAKVSAPTVAGPVTLTVPKGSNSGSVLRLRGKGAPKAGGGHGDQYVRLRVVMPERIDAELEAFLREWAGMHGYDPRRDLEGAST